MGNKEEKGGARKPAQRGSIKGEKEDNRGDSLSSAKARVSRGGDDSRGVLTERAGSNKGRG